MNLVPVLLYLFCGLGVVLAIPLGSTHSRVVRQILLWVGLLVMNVGALLALGAGYLVTRLEGSIPPTLGQYLAPLWLPVALLVLVDGLLVLAYRRKRGPA